MPVAHLEMAVGERGILVDGAPGTITIPAPAAGTIDQASPKVGDTLTVSGSNETDVDPSLYDYIWEVDTGGGYAAAGGTNDGASYDTTGRPAGTYRRAMTIGDLATVYTPGKAVAAGLILTLTDEDTAQSGNGSQSVFNYTLDIGGPGEIFVYVFCSERVALSAQINSGDVLDNASGQRYLSGTSGVVVTAFHDTVASGTTITFDVTFAVAPVSGEPIRTLVWRAQGYTQVVDDFLAGDVDFDSGLSVGSFDVADGDAVIVGVAEQGGGTAPTLVGATADVAAFDIDVADLCLAGSADELTANASYSIGANTTAGDISVLALQLR